MVHDLATNFHDLVTHFFFKKKTLLFGCGPFFKVFIELVIILLLFLFFFFWPQGTLGLSFLTRN